MKDTGSRPQVTVRAESSRAEVEQLGKEQDPPPPPDAVVTNRDTSAPFTEL